MMSNKWAFSLTSLITILALALVFAVPSEAQFSTTVSKATVNPQTGMALEIEIEFGKAVSLAAVRGGSIEVIVRLNDFSTRVYKITADGATVTPTLTGVGEGVLVTPTPGTAPTAFGLDPTDIDKITAGTQSNGQSFTLTIPALALPASTDTAALAAQRVYVTVPAGIASLDPTDEGKDSASKKGSITVNIRDVAAEGRALARTPKVVSIQRLVRGSQTVVAALQEAQIPATPFDVRIVLTEAPNGIDLAVASNLVRVEKATVSNLRTGTPFAWQRASATAIAAPLLPTHAERADTVVPHPIEGMYEYLASLAPTLGLDGLAPLGLASGHDDTVPPPSGPDNMYHEFRVTITPEQRTGDPFDVKIGVNAFHDAGTPTQVTYVPPGFGGSPDLPNGRDILTVRVTPVPTPDLKAGYRVYLPKDVVIPAGGYLVITKNNDGSEIDIPADPTKAPDASKRTPVQMLYNVYEAATLPNLVTEFESGVVVDIESPHAGLVISEVMWGEDASLVDPSNSQWIELHNPGAAYTTLDDAVNTPEDDERTMLVFYGANEFGAVPPREATGELPAGVTDRIGSLYGAAGSYWSPRLEAKGRSGASGTPIERVAPAEGEVDLEVTIAPVSVDAIVSMYRVMGTSNTGQMKDSWMSSLGPKSANFDPLAIGIRHGTPGAETSAPRTQADIDAEAEAKRQEELKRQEEEAAKAKAPVAEADDIKITEIMVDTGSGRLPQWIELANVSGAEKSLEGWSLEITNHSDDDDVVARLVSIDLSGTLGVGGGVGAGGDLGKTLLLVAWGARKSSSLDDSEMAGRIINVSSEVDQRGRYTLLSSMGFRIELLPDQDTGIVEYGDIAGNLGADPAWELEMDKDGDGRSSLIRWFEEGSEYSKTMDGTTAEAWSLASSTGLIKTEATWYGSDEDAGTPGAIGGGPLPVELSHLRPARDKATGAVVITWATESELNNAGFFIKRSNQRNGEFKVINATMVPGAGTTSEKQFYTYTDTTAQPNVVYYYQIEDVSLDGNRQTLTRGIRLKGHVGAAGKLTSTWGELKTSHE